ncbi:hypothetical protein A2U01_0057315, partial [Trifolium medium]|nr:hypothetical protein [Trifolium medium]
MMNGDGKSIYRNEEECDLFW